MERSGVTSREALALRPGDRPAQRAPGLPPHYNLAAGFRAELYIVAAIERSPDNRRVRILTEEGRRFTPWQIERVDE